MKLKYYLMAGLLLAAGSGCNRNSDSLEGGSITSLTNNAPTNGALATMQADATQTKDQFMAAMDRRMKEMDAKIDELSQKSASLKDDAKVQADQALDALRADRAAAAKKYDELKQSSQQTWDKTKAAFQAAWADVQKAFDDAKSKFQ